MIIPPAPRCGESPPDSLGAKVTGARLAATIRLPTRSSLPVPTVVSAPDKWRGSATAPEIATAVGRAAERRGWRVDRAPVSDGGEGFIDAVGGVNRTNRVSGPLGASVNAGWRLEGDEAFIETAAASGLTLVGGASANDALAANTRGTGELIAVAVTAGARRVVVGLGGSASTDGGLGCFEVLASQPRTAGLELVGACDVMMPFAAALEFAEQKGASPAQLRLLEVRLERVAQIYAVETGVDVRDLPGAGAAGGLGGALAALGGRMVSGIEVVAELIGLEGRLATADLVVTGEGLLDSHSFEGKAVGWIVERATALGVPALVIVGDQEPDCLPAWARRKRVEVVSVVERYGRERARSNTLGCIEAAVEEHLLRL